MTRSTLAALALLVGGCTTSNATDAGVTPDDVPSVSDVPVQDDAPVVIDAGGDTWGSWAQGFFATYCVECHAGPPSGRDFTTIADVRRDAADIRCGTAPRTEPQSGCGGAPAAGMFPVGDGPFPSDDERRRLIAWLDAGLPE